MKGGKGGREREAEKEERRDEGREAERDGRWEEERKEGKEKQSVRISAV